MTYHYWQGEKLTLRAIKSSDQELFRSFDDTSNRNIDAIYWPQSEQRFTEWFDSEQKTRTDDSFRFIAENSEGKAVGTIDTFSCNRRNGTFKYGIAVASAHQRKGYAKEMILMVLGFYFQELGYHKASPHVYSFNTASLKLHESMGFIQEGRLREMVFTQGAYHDEVYYGMTSEEYLQLYGVMN